MKGKIGGSTHITTGWKYNWRKENDLCPYCNSTDRPSWGVLRIKKSRFGQFLGCSRYPDCKFTAKYTNVKIKKNWRKIREATINYYRDLQMIKNLK